MNTISTIILGFSLMTLTFCNSHNKTFSNSKDTEISTDTSFTFENYKVNILPSDWQIALTGNGQMCKWNIINDKQNKVLAQLSNETNSYRFNVITNKNLSYKDFELSFRFKAISGNNDQGGGAVWRYIDENNYYIARANPLENNFTLYKVVNGDRQELKNIDVNLKSKQWFNIKIIMKDNKIQCFLNNELKLETTDETFPNAGKIGFWTKSDAVTYFDDLRINTIQ